MHTFCFASGFDATLEDEARFAMNTSLDRDTVMTADFASSCDEWTDVKWNDADLPGDTRGDSMCLDPLGIEGQAKCYAARIRLDPDEINEGSDDAEDRKKTACHEVGHSVGLQHGDDKSDCMRNGEIPDTTAQWRTFNGHHIGDHIDPAYG
jgi:hypothetical protein